MRRVPALLTLASACAALGTPAQAAAPIRTWSGSVVVSRQFELFAGGLAANGDAVTSGFANPYSAPRAEVATRTGFTGRWTVRAVSGVLRLAPNPSGAKLLTASAINDAGASVVLWRPAGRPVRVDGSDATHHAPAARRRRRVK